MSFVKSQEELAKLPRTFDFFDAEMLLVVWETNPQTVARLLPPPLKPARRPLAAAFVANYPRTNFGVTYREAALSLSAEYGGVEGSYYLAMPVTNDIALIGGREVFGYPKKIANVEFRREGQSAGGWSERHGIRYFQAQARLTGAFNAPDAQEVFAETLSLGPEGAVAITYNFKFFPAPDGDGFDYRPRLIREEVELRPEAVEFGEAEVTLRASEDDPWSEVEVVRVLGAVYLKGNNTMKPGKAVAEADPAAFAPYAYYKLDRYVK